MHLGIVRKKFVCIFIFYFYTPSIIIEYISNNLLLSAGNLILYFKWFLKIIIKEILIF